MLVWPQKAVWKIEYLDKQRVSSSEFQRIFQNEIQSEYKIHDDGQFVATCVANITPIYSC